MGKIRKLFITIILLLSAALVSNAQELGVVSFEKLPNDMAARVNNVRDVNGELCALLKIETSATGFHFQGFVEKTEQQVGEIYVYVTPGIRFLTIKHQQLGVLRNYEFPQAIESGCVYAMKLVHGKVETKVTPGITHNYLIIRTKVPTAKIYINDEYVGKGECNKYLPIGREHTYKVEAPLYHTATGTARLTADVKTDLNVDLKPAHGYLQISTTPEQGATIEINGQEYSSLTPFTTTPMASGKYTIQAFRQMYKTATVEAVVEDGKTTKVDIPLLPNYGELSIKTAHNDDEIYVDNTLVGKGSYSKRMDAGVHRIEVKKDKHQTYTTTVELSAGQTIAKNIEALQPIVGSLNINSTPMDATITIDGKNYGTTPNVIPDMLIGRHDITLAKQGYSPLHQTVNVEEGKMAEYTFELQMGNMVSITTDAEGDTLYVDGQYIGTSPIDVTLSFGNHNVEAERGGKRVSRNIDVATGAKQSVSLAFEQKINGHEYVDLGLSVKWATCNVGANAPHKCGNYYAWGETTTKSEYTAGNSRTYGKNMSDISGNSSYDAARANWGSTWRMPTNAEIEELRKNCTWTWTTESGVNGMRVTGPNGNSIFLPAAGYCYGSSRNDVGEDGRYWSSTPRESSTYTAYYRYFESGYRSVDWFNRYYGLTVRPVSDNGENTNYSRVNTYQNKQEITENKTFTVNGVSFTMIAVKGGTYTMGATSEQGSDAWDNEKPAHKETVSDFMIGETEVTQELWQAVMGNNPSDFTGDLQRPVEQVSWDDCQTFIRKLNQLTGQNFRLPSEAEWEYAARGGNRSKGYKYAGSNDVDAVAWYDGNSGSKTHKVKTKQPNELGIYDMSGNVYEWCQDKWCSDYNSPRNSGDRVLRGGSWSNDARHVRVSFRFDYAPGLRNYSVGLRLAL